MILKNLEKNILKTSKTKMLITVFL